MRRTTPLALLLAAVFLTVAASATFTPIPPGVIAPNVIPLWAAGGLSVIVFVGSESRWLREAVPFLRSQRSQLRRLIERGQTLRTRLGTLGMDSAQQRPLSDDLFANLIKWADDCDAFAAKLDEPTFSFGLTRFTRPDSGTIFYMYLDTFLDDRLLRLKGLDDAAHKADKG